jgi:uncharacterized protein YjbI with pentapeptide repeats
MALERRQNPPFQPDLQGAHLDEAQLFRAKIGPALLNGSSWLNASLRRCDFSGSTAYDGCDFRAAELEGTDFSNSFLSEVKFEFSNLSEVNFQGANLHQIDFSQRDFSFVSFADGKIAGCAFDDANFFETNFDGCSIFDVSLTNASLFGAYFSNATVLSERFELELTRTVGIRSGEGTTTIPENVEYPEHWLDLSTLEAEFGALEAYEYELQSWRRSFNSK